MGYGNSKMERSSKNYLKLDMISMNDSNVGKQTYLDFLNRTVGHHHYVQQILVVARGIVDQ